MRGAAVLDDPQAADRGLIFDAVVEQDYAIGDILFDSVAGKFGIAAFAGDHSGQALGLQPGKQPPKFGAKNIHIAETGEKRLDGIEHDPFGADPFDGILQPYE